MISLDQVREIHIELSTLCNARCPRCARNVHGYPYNAGYPETNLGLESVKKILSPEFLQQLKIITACGNFGDFILNPDGLDIVDYWRSCNPKLAIHIITNGSGRSKEYWEKLADLRAVVMFGIDGLEDTHSLYRIDTSWSMIIKNAEHFINRGGKAFWQMTRFNHNEHQVEDCKKLAEKMGFSKFELRTHSRDSGPIFDRSGKFVRRLEGPSPTAKFAPSIEQFLPPKDFSQNENDRKKIQIPIIKRPVESTCATKVRNAIYIAADGSVYPCCYMGFFPNTFTFANNPPMHYANNQVVEMIGGQNNNALEVGLDKAISWFYNVEKKWQAPIGSDQRSYFCDYHCGRQLISSLDSKNFS